MADTSYCEVYKGDICDQTDYDERNKKILIYNDGKTTQKEKEKKLAYLLSKLSNHPYSSCFVFLRQMLCYRFYPVCKRENGRPFYVMNICRNDCNRAKESLCMTHLRNVSILKELMEDSCSNLRQSKCLELLVPTNKTAIEDSCLLDHLKQETRTSKLSMRNADFSERLNMQQIHHHESSVGKKLVCVQRKQHVSYLLRHSHLKTVFQLRNLDIANLESRLIQSYCYTYNTDRNAYERIHVPLGILKVYTPDKYLRLRKVFISLVKENHNVFIRASGTYNLCGVFFNYTIQPEGSKVIRLHATSTQSLPMSLIELSHPLKSFPSDLEGILTQRFRLIRTLNIHKPTWDVVWSTSGRVAAFKGHSSIELGKKSINNVQTEFIVGQERAFWVLRMSMKLKLSQLLNICLTSSQIASMPLLSKKWEHSFDMEKVDFTFATDGVLLPTSKYLQSHFKLARYYMQDRIKQGMTIKARGKILGLKSRDVLLSLAQDDTNFYLKLSMKENKDTTMEIKFRERKDSKNCVVNRESEQNWRIFIKRMEKLQMIADNKGSRTIKIKSSCTYCCGIPHKSLRSVRLKIYQKSFASPYAIFGFGPFVKNFFDIDVIVAQNTYLRHYQLTGLSSK